LKTRIPTEHEEQVGLLQWWKNRFPTILLFSIPNGGKRAISVAKRLKAEGQTPGIPDLFCPKYLLWVEMKRTKGGKLSPEQEKIIKYLKLIGHTVIIGKGATDASKQILTFLKDKQ
jgi:hypothetical protein